MEREKNILMPSMYEKQYMAGIDLRIDQQIDRIQRENGVVKNNRNKEIDSLRVVKSLDGTESITYNALYGKITNMPEQLSVDEVKQIMDLDAITRSVEDVKKRGYYSQNEKYSEEHIARVMIFSSAIANLEGLDAYQQKLLTEVSKYYSSGRLLDIKEQHEQYSAEIAGKELENQYSEKDIRIIQAVIELQNFHSTQKSSKRKEEYEIKLNDICTKYKISSKDKTQVDILTKIIKDAVELDKTRFIEKVKYNSPDEIFDRSSFATKSANKLIKFSYGIQERLATEHLKAMENIVHIDFDSNSIKNEMMEEFFLKMIVFTKEYTKDESIINSPIVQEMFFKYKFSEIDYPEILGVQLSERTKEVEGSEKNNSESLVKSYQEIAITQEDVAKAYEQLMKTKSELQQHSQGLTALSSEVR